MVSADGRTMAARMAERMEGRNKALVARQAGLSRTQLLSILDGTTKHPRIETLDAIAAVLGTTRDWLLYGTESDEEDITTMEQLHAWEQRIVRQRERYIRAILARQAAELANPALPPEVAAAVERESMLLVDRARTRAEQGTDDPRPGTVERAS